MLSAMVTRSKSVGANTVGRLEGHAIHTLPPNKSCGKMVLIL
jgi:hypothetical protein